ncbi:MAG: hypothetical protein JWN29_4216, partial [Acidimicrobiales bacterium]|nr:hypothetical protein [Acidimicrobiales bacterium]
ITVTTKTTVTPNSYQAVVGTNGPVSITTS